MKARGVHLSYRFSPGSQRGAQIENPLFEMLQAVADAGSIRRAASALGLSYRHVWGELKRWECELGEALVRWNKGQPAVLTPFAQRLLWAEARARTRLVPHIEALRHELESVIAEATDRQQPLLSIWASHDLALPRLQDAVRREHQLNLSLRFAGSMDALRALAEGRCTVAGFHVPPLDGRQTGFARALKPLLHPGRHKLIGCARRWQGLMLARGNPMGIVGLSGLIERQARFAMRQEGSGTRLLTDHLLALQGLDAGRLQSRSTLTEDSHLAVAAAVASSAADAGIGLQAAAAAFGLDFVPLVEEDYFLVCLAEQLDSASVIALRHALAGAAWAESLRGLAGYRPDHAGEVLSLTRALPWWRYRTPKSARHGVA